MPLQATHSNWSWSMKGAGVYEKKVSDLEK